MGEYCGPDELIPNETNRPTLSLVHLDNHKVCSSLSLRLPLLCPVSFFPPLSPVCLCLSLTLFLSFIHLHIHTYTHTPGVTNDIELAECMPPEGRQF